MNPNMLSAQAATELAADLFAMAMIAVFVVWLCS